ncbi:MAG: RelA/SpoT domain-containing protein [Pyrinomonadaceae bacterium]
MDLSTPQLSRRAVNRAGAYLIASTSTGSEFEVSLQIVQEWRSSHNNPLQIFREILTYRAETIQLTAITAARLKRFPSILNKLVRIPTLGLSEMQDIGGCRAILRDLTSVYRLRDIYLETDVSNLIRTDNYIASPKETGYRSLHLIYKFFTDSEELRSLNGRKIEIQIRTQIQHAWATSVETASTFLMEEFKSDEGDTRWLRFFALSSSVFAIREGCPIVPGTPENQQDLLSELRSLWQGLNVEGFLRGCGVVVDSLDEHPDDHTFLIRFNVREETATI